ncbi:MAG TPA: D-mannonate oxidoreductase [Clostridiales bacterium]|nr:D-mannonate oxidoreductase [Clostridiales bacterium]
MGKVSFDISGKVAVVTGGAGILCSAMSIKLAEFGAKVAVLDLFKDKAQEVADGIVANGGDAIAVECNVLNKESIEKACKEVMDKYGRVDILINGAGGNKKEATTSEDMKFFDIPKDALSWVLELNFLGTVMPTQVFGKVMADQGDGCVVNISSMAAFTPLTKTISYSAAKAAISNFTQWMAVHFAKEYSNKIRVNAIAPGFLLTQQNYYLLIDKDTGEATPRGEDVLFKTPMNRYGEPDELVGGVIYLASEAASFVTGIVLPIDGGFLAFAGV